MALLGLLITCNCKFPFTFFFVCSSKDLLIITLSFTICVPYFKKGTYYLGRKPGAMLTGLGVIGICISLPGKPHLVAFANGSGWSWRTGYSPRIRRSEEKDPPGRGPGAEDPDVGNEAVSVPAAAVGGGVGSGRGEGRRYPEARPETQRYGFSVRNGKINIFKSALL